MCLVICLANFLPLGSQPVKCPISSQTFCVYSKLCNLTHAALFAWNPLSRANASESPPHEDSLSTASSALISPFLGSEQ